MAISLSDNIRIGAPKPIDDRYLTPSLQPYADVAEVNSTIVSSRRYIGLRVLVGTSEYVYLEGITNSDLVPVPGSASDPIILRKTATHVQWRYASETESDWKDLIPLTDIKGDVGATGPIGATGPAGATGTAGAQGATGVAGLNGATGATGPKGNDGASFSVDVVEPLINLSNYDSQPEGFSFLASDTGNLYIREGITPGVWSQPIPFQGPTGSTGPTGATGLTPLVGVNTQNEFVLLTGGPIDFDEEVLLDLNELRGATGPQGDPAAYPPIIGGDGITVTTDPVTGEITVLLTPPYLAPSFSSFAISSPTSYAHNAYVEVGTVFASSMTFTYGVSNSSNLDTGSDVIKIKIGATVLHQSSGVSSPQVVSGLPAAVTSAITTSGKAFTIEGRNSQGQTFTRALTLVGGYPWYWGKVSGNRPTPDASLVTSGTKVLAASTDSVTVPYSSGDSDYLWFATPSASTTKTKWAESGNPLNTGAIGGAVAPGGNLFPGFETSAVTTALWDGVNYKIYVSNYPVAVGSLVMSNT